MQKSFFNLLTVTALTVSSSLACWSQGVSAPSAAPRNPDERPPEGRLSRENKEKAEDAELMRQLEAQAQDAEVEAQQARGEKSRADRGARGGGKAGVAALPAGAPGVISFDRQNLLTRPSAGPRALVVHTGDPDPKTQAGLEEDLAVMSHLLDKALEEVPGAQGNGNRVMGIDVFFAPASSPVRSLYVDNYGALFFLKVNFPLTAPAEKHVEEKPPGDSAWEEARQELYGQKQGNGAGEPGEDFVQERVDKLKETLFETLKNATNIRGLKSEDYVTICVSGGSGNARVRKMKANPAGMEGGNFIFAGPAAGAAKRSLLTLRAKKSEIDDFAKGKLTLEQFQKHTPLSAYTADATSSSGENVAWGTYTVRAK